MVTLSSHRPRCYIGLRWTFDPQFQVPLIGLSAMLEKHLTTCPLDCPDLCALEVTTEGGRLVEIDGRRGDPVTRGYICVKVRRFGDHVYAVDRLLKPALRVGAKGAARFEPISWDEAFALIVAEILRAQAAWGSESILPFSYGGSNGK